ncbi:hypothetical protein P22_2616 [Propionispora sp. 2/2-37]|uniref:ATP-binding protein n=1 Tax=Propionispora sp. 2/2-37 TaxID=1677858 RepID=UPI0006BB6023|nr:4Fe-4S binding protein [Propionispora sp. 2/2-37]CUH96526.1 hypothetical protein P22_2616 [Propionispora sp. 2/2-37]
MLRKIIAIEEEKCNGCGLCIQACHEGALQLINGKAQLIGDAYCDGLGACLPQCPTGAITIEERESAAFDEVLVKQHLAAKQEKAAGTFSCPGSRARLIKEAAAPSPAVAVQQASQLRQWPCQIQLVPVNAPYFENAQLLIAADCAAYAYANLHNDFMRNKITLIGCPKLDHVDYAEKLTAILKAHSIKSLTLLRMEVPCCGGLANAVKAALTASGAVIPWRIVIIGTDGRLVEEC